MIGCHDLRADGWHQRAGIDRLIVLSSSKTLHIDEKVREKDYGDILLEFWSDKERRTPGWIAKDLSCDFIAYAIAPSRRCYLLPFQPLRAAWRDRRADWVARFGRREAQNAGYTTVGVPVPVEEVFTAITDALLVSWAEP